MAPRHQQQQRQQRQQQRHQQPVTEFRVHIIRSYPFPLPSPPLPSPPPLPPSLPSPPSTICRGPGAAGGTPRPLQVRSVACKHKIRWM
jgi:hypothetical protein